MDKKKLLIVEDDMFIRDIYQTRFQQEGFEVMAAENGLVALEKMEQVIPDVILLDVMMPYMDGMEVLKSIKADERLKKIPIIMLTNVSEKIRIEEAFDFGADELLTKSNFIPSEIVAKVRLLLKM
ncbi:MAG: response regulator [Candidatus Moraniibacteriota bacterium]